MEVNERIFRIGTSSECEIVVPGGEPADMIWVQLAISTSSMHLLTVMNSGIKCSVNGNPVTKQYWVHADDKIEIQGYILNWAYINGDADVPFIKSGESASKHGLKIFAVILMIAAIAAAAFFFVRKTMLGNDQTETENSNKNVLDTVAFVVPEPDSDIEVMPNETEPVVVNSKDVKPKSESKTEQTSDQNKVEKKAAANKSIQQQKEPAIIVTSETPIAELWTVVGRDSKNSLALYYLAKYYHKRKPDAKANDFWNKALQSDVKRCLHQDIRTITSERFVFVMLARAYANIPRDMDESIKTDIVSMLRKTQNKYPGKYTY